MVNKEMKFLDNGDIRYEIVDASARSNIQTINTVLDTKADTSNVTALDTRVTGVEGDIDDINDRLTNDYIPVDGENLVTPQNIQGVGFTKTSQEIAGENIFSSDLLFEEDYYVNIDTSVNPPAITHGAYSGYKTYCVPVDGVSKYTFTSTRFACLAKGNTLASEAVGTLQAYATEMTTTGASYLFLSYPSGSDFDNIEVHKITEQDAYTDFEMPEWSGIPALQNRVYELQYLNGVNLFDHAELIKENGYATISNGKITFANSSDYNAYLIPVDGKSIYTFTSCRFVFLVDSDKESAIGSLLQNVVKVDSTGASYIAFSFDTSAYPVADYSVIGDVRINTNKQPFAYVSGNLASGGNLQLTAPRTNLRKGERIVFEGDITSFSSIKIGLSFSTAVGTEANQMNTFLIDGANISYYVRSNSTPITVAHGLTIANNIQLIWEMTATASVKFTLISNGNLFEHEFTNFTRQVIGNPFVYSADSELTGCKLTWTCVDIKKSIWMFGDSYFAYDPARWTYYLYQYGYDNNCLLDGFPGEGSTNGRVAFNNLLQFGTPKFAVWCLGMNDGGDSDSAPSSDWETAKNYFLNLCAENDVVPIFATIPTVPSINHEQKNTWIRSSGYRYIDFAKAVGASASGVWYGDMLASDNVHPSASGARALFARVLLDLPEIMVDLRG